MSARRNEPTGWMGWIYFASLMMLLTGGFQIIAGLTAIFKDNFYLVGKNSLVLFNYTAWGWVHLVMGAIIVLAGLSLFSGALWSRVLAIFLAFLSLFANMAFIEAYPLWSILMIVVDIFVIYALTVHGSELRE